MAISFVVPFFPRRPFGRARALLGLLPLLATLNACGSSTADYAGGSQAISDKTDDPGTAANPVYMLGQFGGFARANVGGHPAGGQLEVVGGPLSVRIAQFFDGKVFVMALDTRTMTAAEGWVRLDGRTLQLGLDGDCRLRMERHLDESEWLGVTLDGASCPASWDEIGGLRKGVKLPRTLQYWADQRQGFYRPSYAASTDARQAETSIDLSVKRDNGRARVNPDPVIDTVSVEIPDSKPLELQQVKGSTPNRYELPAAACGGATSAKPQIHFLADGSFELLGCPKKERYFIEDPRHCGALSIGSTCKSQELIDAQSASEPQGP